MLAYDAPDWYGEFAYDGMGQYPRMPFNGYGFPQPGQAQPMQPQWQGTPYNPSMPGQGYGMPQQGYGTGYGQPQQPYAPYQPYAQPQQPYYGGGRRSGGEGGGGESRGGESRGGGGESRGGEGGGGEGGSSRQAYPQPPQPFYMNSQQRPPAAGGTGMSHFPGAAPRRR